MTVRRGGFLSRQDSESLQLHVCVAKLLGWKVKNHMTHSRVTNFSIHDEEGCSVSRALVYLRSDIYRRRQAIARLERAVPCWSRFRGLLPLFHLHWYVYTRYTLMRAFRRLRVHCLVFSSRSDTPPPPLPLPSPGPAGRPRKRVSERVRDPILHLPFLDRVVYLSLFVWLIYDGVTVSVFHSFLFPPRSTTDHESVSCACVLATLRNPPAPSQRCTNSARRGYMSGHFRKRSISFKKSANHTLAGEKSVESFWETNFIKFI